MPVRGGVWAQMASKMNPARRYERGADLERRIVAALTRDGYWCARVAGSRGVADVVAIKPTDVVLVQAKRDGRLGPDDRARLLTTARLAGAIPVLASAGPGGRGIIYRELKGPGPRDYAPWSADY